MAQRLAVKPRKCKRVGGCGKVVDATAQGIKEHKYEDYKTEAPEPWVPEHIAKGGEKRGRKAE